MLWYVRHKEIAQAEVNVTEHAHFVEASILRNELEPVDLRGPVTGAERQRLDRVFKQRVLILGTLRAKIYVPPDGVVTYSTDPSLIGTRTDDLHEFRDVLGGAVRRDVAPLNHEGGTGRNVKALEVYVPLRLRGEQRPKAVLELYQSFHPVATAVSAVVVPFGILLLLTLVALWIVLFPLVRRMGLALERDRAARRSAEAALEETSEQLRHAQKLEAVGRLAGGIAHDFNNLLVAINGYAEFLVDAPGDEQAGRYAREIRAAGQRAAALTQQLLAFSRRQVLNPQVMNLNDAVLEVESMLSRLISADIEMVLDLEEDLPLVEADPSQMSQVLVNLAVNARDAMPSGGVLAFATRREGDVAVLSVADTGVGMDEQTRVRIFEPFFTTKPIGEGTGLGLATVYGIVTQSGGSIDVASALGTGSTFTIRLPATTRAGSVADASTPMARVLVADELRR